MAEPDDAASPRTADGPAPERPGPGPGRPARRRRRARRSGPWAVAAIIVAVILLANAAAAVIGPNIPRRSGSEERAFIKADQMYRRSGPTAVAFLGSSETAGGIVPSTVAAHAPDLDGGVYNAALAGTFLPTYRDWADEVVVPTLDPDVVVIGMLPMTVADIPAKEGPLAGYTKARRAYLSAIDQISGGELGRVGWEARQRSALVRYRPWLRQPQLLAKGIRNTLTGEEPKGRPAGTGMDWSKETNPATVAANTGPDGEVFDYHQQSLPVDADPLGAAIYRAFAQGTEDLVPLERFTAHLQARGVTPVVLLLPVDRGPLAKGGADLATLDGWARDVEAWGKEHGVPVRDEFTKDWSSDLFHDRNHLDEAGAEQLSTVVGRWLQDLCDQGAIADACRPAR
ncbi:MAG: hypothetical protein U0P45_00385 [Acidimicrobiales bacterium]